MSLRRQLSRQTRAIVLVIVTAVAGVASAVYLLGNERLASPFASSYSVYAPFDNVSGIDPGLGIAVNVAGVRVGQVTGTSLRGGHGVLRLQIDPHLLPHVYADADATLVPRTPLKDMQVDLAAGGPPARPLRDGDTLPLAQTVTPVDSDELLSSLDADTRTWIQILIADLSTGLHGRGRDFGLFLRALSPTAAQTRQIADLLAARRHDISRIVHNLALLTSSLAGGDRDLVRVVNAGDATLHALAVQEAPLRQSVGELPATLAAARTTVRNVTAFAGVLHPTLDALTPLARRLPALLRNSQTLMSGGGALPIAPVRSFAAAMGPLASLLSPTTREVSASLPPLVRIAGSIGRVTDATAFVPGGNDQGYLYWLAWFAHNVNSVFSTGDAHGAVARGLALVSCSSGSQPVLSSLLDQILKIPTSCKTGP